MSTIAEISGNDVHRAMAERTTILRVPAGSNLHGLSVPGTDDDDVVGVCVEDIDAVLGHPPFEQYIYRTATERTGTYHAPSQPGDLDLTIFSLRKFVHLALDGNPQVIQTLFVPASLCLHRDARGAQLQDLAPSIVSKRAGVRYLSYLQSQRQRLLGLRGQKGVNRPSLVAKFGFDTKYAMHILRLGFQGVELLSTGRLTLPMPKHERDYVYAVRSGGVSFQDVVQMAGRLEQHVKDLLEEDLIQAEPDARAVQAWTCSMYLENWKARHAS